MSPAVLLLWLASAGPPDPGVIAVLQRRAAAVAPGTPAARDLAAQFGRLGGEFLAGGQIGPAIELLAEAYGLDESNGLVLAQLTLAYVGAEDLESARFYLKRAEVRAVGAPPEIYRVLGDAYVGLHRLDDAVAAWSEAVRLGGQDPQMLARLVRTRDELALSRGQRSLVSGHFALFADPALSDVTLRECAGQLETEYARLSATLGAAFERPQVVVLYSGRDYFALASVPDWVAGVFDGKIRVSVEPDGAGAWARDGILTHELTHALLRKASRDRAPAWLHEGYAQWSEGRRMPRSELPAALGGRAATSLARLDEMFRGSTDRRDTRASYAQALSLVEYVVSGRGPGALTCVVEELSRGVPFDEALRRETAWSEDTLLAGWRRWAGI